MYWRPAVHSFDHVGQLPEIGSLVAVDRQPWIVASVQDDGTHVELELHKPGQEHPRYRARYSATARRPWTPLPEHYAICGHCAELAPCVGHEQQVNAHRIAVRLTEELSILPGMCPACNEPITARQGVIDFPGENVRNPLAPPTPVFHTRQRCWDAAALYEDAWVRADPRRQRSALTLRCRGRLITHSGGRSECSEGVLCPSMYARHTTLAACYLDGACAEGCVRGGHPGARAPRPRDPRQLHVEAGRDV